MDKEMMDKLLCKAVEKYEISVTEKMLKKVPSQSVYETLKAEGFDYAQLRNKLYSLGNVLEEDKKKKSYVTAINGGIGKANPCIVLTCMDKDTVYIDAFAPEGLINQHTAKKVVESLKKVLSSR